MPIVVNPMDIASLRMNSFSKVKTYNYVKERVISHYDCYENEYINIGSITTSTLIPQQTFTQHLLAVWKHELDIGKTEKRNNKTHPCCWSILDDLLTLFITTHGQRWSSFPWQPHAITYSQKHTHWRTVSANTPSSYHLFRLALPCPFLLPPILSCFI